MTTFSKRSRIAATAEEVFRWHASPGAFERLAAPWDPVEILERAGSLAPGSRTVLRVRVGPFRRRWVAEHVELVEGRRFRDRQVEGPFAAWDHVHSMEPDGDGCTLEDRIEYRLPAGSGWLAGGAVRRKLGRVFAYRHRVTAADVAAHRGVRPMRILLVGASGFVGSALKPFLQAGGHAVSMLSRGGAAPSWDPDAGTLDAAALEGHDAVIHLGGAGIAERRWSAARKELIRSSRVKPTALLAATLAKLQRPPRVFVVASATGWYGDPGDREVDESTPAGTGFLPEVCREWEAAAKPAADRGIRTVHARFGIILGAAGGALAKMRTPFSLGLGGVLGSGTQVMSWVALDDVLGALLHVATTESLSGPVNVVAPAPATNREFTKALGRVLGRWTIFPMPGFVARLAFGEMAGPLLLSGARVKPSRLQATGYTFRYPDLEGALRHVLGKESA